MFIYHVHVDVHTFFLLALQMGGGFGFVIGAWWVEQEEAYLVCFEKKKRKVSYYYSFVYILDPANSLRAVLFNQASVDAPSVTFLSPNFLFPSRAHSPWIHRRTHSATSICFATGLVIPVTLSKSE